MMEQENLPDEEMSIIRTPAQKPQGYTSTRLIKELSFKADITAVQSKAVLDALVEIAYREASRNCFVLPGLCKFELVRRKARRFRNPVTGEPLVLPERDALTVKLSKRAKEATVPHVTPLTPAEYEAYLVKKAAEEEAAHKAAEEAARLKAEAEAKKAAEAEAERQAAEEASRRAAEEASRRLAETMAKRMAEAARRASEEAAHRKAAEEAARKAVEEEAAHKAAEEEAARKKAAEEAAARAAAEEAARKAAEEAARKKAAEEEAARKAAEEERRAHEGFVEAPQVKGDRAISFKCVTCGQEIIAPEETIGYEAECPTCGAILVVPAQSQPGTMYAKDATAAAKKEVISVEQAENLNPSALKNRTIRIDSLTFLEESAEQEKLNRDARMKRAILSTTMRFDLPDEF